MGKLFGITDEPNIIIGEPFDRANESFVRWLHLAVQIKRKRWVGEIKQIPQCRLEFIFRPIGGGDSLIIEGEWAPDQEPKKLVEKTLRENDTDMRFSIVVRSLVGIRPPIQPNAQVCPNITYITGMRFLEHGDTSAVLSPGTYELTIRLYAGHRTWSKTQWVLENPEQGIDGLVLRRSNRHAKAK